MTKRLVIIQLYPDQMNIYGDTGNAQIICQRVRLYGYEPQLLAYNSKADLNNLLKADLVVGGGGQDSGQRAILADLAKIKNNLLSMAAEKVPMLMICGLYQLFGHYFRTKDGDKLDGIGLFDLVTNGSDRRLIGNAIVESDEFGELIGYENHSGITKLNDNQAALGQIVQGYGNDGSGSDEGAMRYCVVGTYLHGPVLAKNSRLTDWLILRAVDRKYGNDKLRPADEDARARLKSIAKLEQLARDVAKTRPQQLS